MSIIKTKAVICGLLVAVAAVPAFFATWALVFPAVQVMLAMKVWMFAINQAEEGALEFETGLSTADFEWLEAQTKACDQAINTARYGRTA